MLCAIKTSVLGMLDIVFTPRNTGDYVLKLDGSSTVNTEESKSESLTVECSDTVTGRYLTSMFLALAEVLISNNMSSVRR